MTATLRDRHSIDVAGREDERIRLTAAHLDDLRSRIAGPMLFPGDPGWDEAVMIWNAMMSKAPALVVRTTGPVASSA
jgi:hypothetical protein